MAEFTRKEILLLTVAGGPIDLSSQDLDELDMSSVNLRGANLEGARAKRSTFTETHLEGANLRGALLNQSVLTRAHLEGADLSGADLRGAYLSDTNLEGANLTGAILTADGKFLRQDAVIVGVKLTGATMPDGAIYDPTKHDKRYKIKKGPRWP